MTDASTLVLEDIPVSDTGVDGVWSALWAARNSRGLLNALVGVPLSAY